MAGREAVKEMRSQEVLFESNKSLLTPSAASDAVNGIESSRVESIPTAADPRQRKSN